MAFLSEQQLAEIGFKSLGTNVLISDKSSIYNAKNIEIGSNVRIDDFSILSAGDGGIVLEDYVHIACFCSLIGQGLIRLCEYSGISSRVSIYSSNDDYSGNYMTNPTVPPPFTNVTHGDVVLEKHAIIGAGTIILPKVTIGMGTAVGALSLVMKSCEPYSIYLGNPAKRLKSRANGFETKEIEFLKYREQNEQK